MFMEPFTGPISGSLQRIPLAGSLGDPGSGEALGSSTDSVATGASFLAMPLWLASAAFAAVGL